MSKRITQQQLIERLEENRRIVTQYGLMTPDYAPCLFLKNGEEEPEGYYGSLHTTWGYFIEEGDTDEDAKRKYCEWGIMMQQQNPEFYQQHISENGIPE